MGLDGVLKSNFFLLPGLLKFAWSWKWVVWDSKVLSLGDLWQSDESVSLGLSGASVAVNNNLVGILEAENGALVPVED